MTGQVFRVVAILMVFSLQSLGHQTPMGFKAPDAKMGLGHQTPMGLGFANNFLNAGSIDG